MNKNTDKEKGMKMEMLDADREYFLVYANSVKTFISTLMLEVHYFFQILIF